MSNALENFSLEGKVIIITGGAGLMGAKHAEAIVEANGIAVLWDIDAKAAGTVAESISGGSGAEITADRVDITDLESIKDGFERVLKRHGKADGLINNAANDPKVDTSDDLAWSRFENFSLDAWNMDMGVGLTGAFLCSQVVGSWMAENGGGVIVNIASDLSVISPDQRLYRQQGLADDRQPVKPVTYSIVKHGLIGLTKYLATYWAKQNIRVNAISPGGIYTGQPEEFVARLTDLIPMGRMADKDEYKSAIVFLCSNASGYMNGQNLIMDGGRTVL
ncbi:MAG TPA: SDR family oxidoreductase [Rhodospirillales bacterium]|nr:SDR family oxidoreductase [Rhodospirillales bacterium]